MRRRPIAFWPSPAADDRMGGMHVDPHAAGFDPARLDRITEHLQRSYVGPGKIAGCQTAVVRHGHLALFSSLGSMDVERGTPMADDTIFRVYSMS